MRYSLDQDFRHQLIKDMRLGSSYFEDEADQDLTISATLEDGLWTQLGVKNVRYLIILTRYTL